MPKFAANLSMLFTELPFLERFAAAARAGFEAVEFLFPYEYAAGKSDSACRRTSRSGCCSIPHPATSTPENGARRHPREKRGGPTRY